MATMMTRTMNKAGIDTTSQSNTKFEDDNDMHDWGRNAIYFMSNQGIIKGVGNNTFDVNGNATKEQALLLSQRSVVQFSK